MVTASARQRGSFWQAITDGDPDAVLAGEQYIYGSDRAGGVVVLRLRGQRLT